MTRRTDTPWGLSVNEQNVLDMVCLTGCHKMAAEKLVMQRTSVSRCLTQARIRMKLANNTLALIAWDRFAMGREQ